MAERNMTPKGFLHKTTTKAANSAAAFLNQYREYLTTGELAEVISPIIKKMDDKELLPSPALRMVQAAVMGHIVATDRAKAEQAMEAAEKGLTPKKWTATIYTGTGAIATRLNSEGDEEDLIKGFQHPADADRWADRRLFEGASDWYGEIQGLGTMIHIARDDAIARIMKKPKGPTTQHKSTTTTTLGFGVKAHQTRASFSRG